MRLTKKEFLTIQKEILTYFKPSPVNKGETPLYKDSFFIPTIWGDYIFCFSDSDTIFGRFLDVEKMNSMLEERYQEVNASIFKVIHYPNVSSGKMNFHFESVYEFIDTLDRLTIEKAA